MPIQSIYKESEGGRRLLYAWFPAMHTRIDLILCDQPEEKLKAVAENIHKEVQEIEKLADYYNASSELYRINEDAAKTAVVVNGALFEMIDECIGFQEKTRGYFDITIRSESYDKNTIRRIKMCAEDSTVYFTQKGIRLDLSGYAKGYALEKTRNLLYERGISNALINMGNSSVLALGDHPHGKGWKIGFGLPAVESREQDIHLHNECFTTSGNESDGRKHIINPHTGAYVEGRGRLSVVTTKGTEGEVFSTALLVASPSECEKLATDFGIEYHKS